MARRGQLVGDAYVRIHADSSAIDNELRREFNARKAGRTSGNDFVEEFADAVKRGSKDKVEAARQSLIRGAVGGKSEWDKQFRASGLRSVDDFVKAVEQRFKTLAGAKNLKGINEVTEALDDLNKWAEDSRVVEALAKIDKAIKDQDKAFASYRENIRFTEAQSRKMEKAILDQDRAWQTYGENIDTATAKTLDMQRAYDRQNAAFKTYTENLRATAGRDREFQAFVTRWNKSVLDQDRAWQTYADNVGKRLPSALKRLSTAFDRDKSLERYADRVGGVVPRAIVRLNRSLDTSEHHFSRFATAMGRVFGKGSRNNFFNFVGSVVGGLSQIGVGVAHAALRVGGFAGTFTHILSRGVLDTFKGFGQLFQGGGFSGIGDALKNVGKGFGDLAVQIGTTLAGAIKFAIPVVIALAAAFTLASVAIFPLIALVANLAGAVFVLGAEIAVALAGGILALAPALLAFAGGIGFTILAITKLNNATKATKKNLKPLTDAWKDFNKQFEGKPVEEFAKALGNLAPLVETILIPLMKGFATQTALITDTFAALFTGPRIQGALKEFTETLPRIFGNFGRGIAELSAGLIEFFEPILPFAELLSQKFLELMTQFNDWASSAEGKNSIADFMQKAWAAATDLWNIIGLAGQALGGLIGLATDSPEGGTVLDSIKAALQDLVDFINSPEGKQAIQDFFENARTTAAQLGSSIREIGTALASVDWQAASDKANAFIDLIGRVGAAFTILSSSHSANFQIMFTAWTIFGDTVRGIYDNVIGPVISAIIGGFVGILTAIGTMLRVLAKVPGMGFLEAVADELDKAIIKTAKLSNDVRKLPDGDININVGLSGPGVAALQSSMARRRPDVFFGAAAGGILTGPTFVRSNVIAGEAGREAIVPLDRPLALVDRSVRELAAFARGLPTQRMASGGVLGGGITISPGAIIVNAPNSDPVAVAEAVVDRLSAAVRV